MEFPLAENLIRHSHSLQFVVAIKGKSSSLAATTTVNGDRQKATQSEVSLSDVFDKLHKFCSDRNVTFNISQTLLDRAFEQLLARDDEDHGPM